MDESSVDVSWKGTAKYSQWMEPLKSRKLPEAKDILELCSKVMVILEKEANVVTVTAPCTVVGDIHGQFYDLLELFRVGGEAPTTNYVLCGDYVDRGYYSVEVILVLFTLKVRYPGRLTLIRGNHESRQITQVYGFYDECLKKFGSAEVWNRCMDVFDRLPLGCLIQKGDRKRVLCLHAGLSPSLDTLDQIKDMERIQEVPHEGPMCDLLWSDPEDIQGWSISPRGAGYVFGDDIVSQFNQTNNIETICRSHQLVMEGYKWMFDTGDGNPGQLVTVWSAPNYCYRCANEASILEYDENMNHKFIVFGPAPQNLREKPPIKQMPDYFL